MRRSVIPSALSIMIVAALTATPLAPTAASAAGGTDDYRPVRGPSAPAEHRYLQKTVPGEGLPRHAYADAAAEALALPHTDGSWSMVGPTNIGGRVTGLAVDPETRDVVYAAAASGGLWKSTDAGRTFATAWPDTATQAMGAVATGSDGTLYAGTGEVNPGGGSLTYGGTGIYASRDGGASWRSLGLADSGAIGAITIDPRDPKRIFVAAAGSLFNAGGDRGVYRSTDGGASWTRVLAGANDFTGANDVIMDPTNPRRLYAAMWDHRREPDKRSYGGVGSGVYRSTDGGDTWQRLDSLRGVDPALGRIGIALAPSNPKQLYAILSRGASSSGAFDGFYVSDNGGDSWTRTPDAEVLTESQSSFPWWFAKLWVDPRNAQHVHVAGVGLPTSRNGGRSWTYDDDSMHVDQHAMVWDPRYPNRVYLGNDGGVYRSDKGGDRSWVKSEYQPFMQFYSGAISPQDVGRYSGGTQDNGSLRSWGHREGFNSYLGGDGEENLINPKNKENVYACYQYGNCFRSVDGGETMSYFGNAVTSARRNWFTPVQFDPVDPSVMYYGGNQLNRSTDGGVTWKVISPDLTGGPGRDAYPYGTITTHAAAVDGTTLYVGTDDGRVWVTRDLGATWTLLLSGQPWVTRITASDTDPGTAWLTLSGYRAGSDLPHVLRTSDYGATWTDLTGNLPQAPVNDVVRGSDGALYVATDQGVFVSPSGGPQWLRLGRDLPMVPVDDIEYDAGTDRLVAATFGRGIYRITVP